jgi:hypothetical protein
MGGVKNVDHGYDALVKRVFGFGHPTVSMGIVERDGAKPRKARLEEGDDKLTLIDVAAFLEFGTEDEPARSIIRAWFDEASPQMHADLSKLMRSVIRGDRTKDDILALLGLRGQGSIQKRMADNLVTPPTSDATNERKRSTVTAIDTGQTRSAISFVVREAK